MMTMVKKSNIFELVLIKIIGLTAITLIILGILSIC